MMLKGYRTIIGNVIMAGGSVALIFGIEIPPEELAKISSGCLAVMGVVNLILRAMTDSKIGKKE